MQAIVFVTHIESEPVHKHFLRLKAEIQGLLDVFLCVHEPAWRAAEPLPADFRLSASDAGDTLPTRHAAMMQRGRGILPGYTDLAYMPALLSQRLSAYAHIWVMEYDVDYAGPWDEFFSPLMENQTDLLGAMLYPRAQFTEWFHWRWFETPAEVSVLHHTRSFLPIVRFSRPMLDCYATAMRNPAWRGHTEALYPTIARHHGLTIEDIGGSGPFTPPSFRGKNYLCYPSPNGELLLGTLIYRPTQHNAYFMEAPGRFPARGYLYHPVKRA